MDEKKRKCRVDKERIINIISKVLDAEENVIFAYLAGSFAKEIVFEDIDIFLYLKENFNDFTFLPDVREKIYRELVREGIESLSIEEIDVNIINHAPYDFVIDILRDGIILTDKNLDLRTDYIEQISDEYRVNHFILDEAFK